MLVFSIKSVEEYFNVFLNTIVFCGYYFGDNDLDQVYFYYYEMNYLIIFSRHHNIYKRIISQ